MQCPSFVRDHKLAKVLDKPRQSISLTYSYSRLCHNAYCREPQNSMHCEIMHYEHAFWQVQNHTSLDFPLKIYALSDITLCIMRKSTVSIGGQVTKWNSHIVPHLRSNIPRSLGVWTTTSLPVNVGRETTTCLSHSRCLFLPAISH
ncbi:hypothetical protein PAXRUDRAFT_585429 [Paxillus rubicundulus Ve08.2h10]|uniref:Uncharacterized protein n=1 Tax=Paxillus rubicundulus Ve08.2h10 TaxID=930991 RepID=A0A0D0D198_9AGAM|nr:hypothetical protein PAXRUDRAFT_585429 [Paxillus rubicundulus Ve08.2h10]